MYMTPDFITSPLVEHFEDGLLVFLELGPGDRLHLLAGVLADAHRVGHGAAAGDADHVRAVGFAGR